MDKPLVAAITTWVFLVLVQLAFATACVLVAWHFIKKFW